MAPWMSALTLVVLCTICIPTSQGFLNQHLCGAHLVDALYFVCGSRGFVYSPTSRSDVEQPLADLSSRNELEELPFQQQDNQKVKRARGIDEQCCHNTCSLSQLENYCN